MHEALAAAGVSPARIDAVVRTGGSSLIPAFEQLLVDTFGADKLHMQDAFGSVVSGLALEAARQPA